MAKKLSTAMLTALSIAHSQGEVLVGDDQRVALLGMAGRVSSNTITALHNAGLLRNVQDTLAFELTINGLSALGHAGVISAEEYTATRRKWDEWMDVAHAEALAMDRERHVLGTLGPVEDVDSRDDQSRRDAETLFKQYEGTPARFNPEVIDELHAFALKMDAKHEARTSPQPGDTYSRSLRHGAEVVRVDEVRAGNVWYRFAQGKVLGLSAPYSLRLDRFVERYSRVPA